MSYRDASIPEELNRRIQEISDFPPQRHKTLGDLVETYKGYQGAPQLEDLVSEGLTRHEVGVGEQSFHTHCFLDALILPFFFGEDAAEIRSTSPVSDEEITVLVSGGALAESPPKAVISFGVARAGQGPPQVVGCPYINAFTSQAEYERWATDNPQVITMPLRLEDAFTLARDMINGSEDPSESSSR